MYLNINIDYCCIIILDSLLFYIQQDKIDKRFILLNLKFNIHIYHIDPCLPTLKCQNCIFTSSVTYEYIL